MTKNGNRLKLVIIAMIVLFSSINMSVVDNGYAYAASYKRISPSPTGNWKVDKTRYYTVTVKRDSKAGALASISSILAKLAGEEGWMVAGVAAMLSPHMVKGNNYMIARRLSRSNKYVQQYRTTYFLYKDKGHKHLISNYTREQSIIVGTKLVKVK